MKQVREGEILYDILYMWNLKRNDTNELTYRTETDSQNEFMVEGEGRRQRVRDGHIHTVMFKMDNQQRPTV